MRDLLHYIDPEFLVTTLGLLGVTLVIFAESGLFFGFFLPGDSLLFTAGLFASQGYIPLPYLIILSIIAAIAGDSVGYAFGKKVGPSLFSREDSIFFHKKHAERAKSFYEKYGVKTIVLARFVPIVRTFAPIIAGVAHMRYRTFLSWNIAGGILWVVSMTFVGFFLGSLVPEIKEYLEYVIVGIILISFMPIFREIYKAKKSQKEGSIQEKE